ncbi:hypothetical protein BGZ97_006072 [Linnemannia gamsii]|uniref:F-box domain-containing protein n=1 Tax=Linnemannia gamsii TaxID=64522 RepID=A0A9P6RG16_9FUNG|nr:hypothetical protein BGZ97_006072 [Linnemannia gamsii]
MHALKPLPIEILALIFQYLTPRDLYRTMTVSRLWFVEAEASLYRNIALRIQFQGNDSLLQALKIRKHLLRRLEWSSSSGREVSEADLLDILLDYRPSEENNGSTSSDILSSSTPAATNYAYILPSTSPPAAGYPLGPGRPALRHLSYVGGSRSWQFFDSVLYKLTTLTTLELCFSGNAYQPGDMYVFEMDKVLTVFPQLKHLGITGKMLEFAPTTARHDGGYNLILDVNEEEADRTTRHGVLEHHHLGSFRFNPIMMRRSAAELFLCFRRLTDLTKISIESKIFNFDNADKSRPWAIGRALKQFCPRLETINISSPVVFWLFDLAIVPPDKDHHLTALVPDVSLGAVPDAQTKKRLRRRLQDQEVDELLEGRSASPFFPQLRRLILEQGHSLSAQDLISLGVQARFLTHLEINYQPTFHAHVWEIYDRDAAASASATATTRQRSTWSDVLVEDRRLRKRRQIENRDVMLFLQVCSSLRHFALTKFCIPFEHLLVADDDIIKQRSLGVVDDQGEDEAGTTEPSRHDDKAAPFIQPWACEKTLESLIIGFDIATNRPEDHRLVWTHLGRFKKLRSLTFVRDLYLSSNSRSTLIPSLAFGVEGVLATEGGGKGMSVTLAEIRSLPSWWTEESPGEMVLWFARSFPKLRVLGLMRYREEVEGGKEGDFSDFLEDEDVKLCSIGHVFFEPQYSYS